MKLLHIDTSILGGNSVSREISRAVVDKLSGAGGDVDIVYRDLAAEPIAHLSADALQGLNAEVERFEPGLQKNIATGAKALEEFLAADTVVIGVAFYNFGIPSQLKAWVDRITVAGRTFRYTEAGPEGLAGGKRVVLAIARGGLYGPGSGREAFEHAESYLRVLFGFLGITNIEVIAADGIAVGPDHRKQAIDAALAMVDKLPA